MALLQTQRQQDVNYGKFTANLCNSDGLNTDGIFTILSESKYEVLCHK